MRNLLQAWKSISSPLLSVVIFAYYCFARYSFAHYDDLFPTHFFAFPYLHKNPLQPSAVSAAHCAGTANTGRSAVAIKCSQGVFCVDEGRKGMANVCVVFLPKNEALLSSEPYIPYKEGCAVATFNPTGRIIFILLGTRLLLHWKYLLVEVPMAEMHHAESNFALIQIWN